MFLQFEIVQFEHRIVPAVEEVEKTLDQVYRMPLTQIPLHEDERNVYLVEKLSSRWICENINLVTFDIDLHQRCFGSHQRQQVIQKNCSYR